MVQLKRNLLSVALASATLMLAHNAHAAGVDAQPAQDQTDETAKKQAAEDAKALDKVVVNGIRRGIESAIQTKQKSTQIVETVSAEDIGKLPDSSIAESIARLPGLTAQRERGRATQINIRGLSGDFAGTTLNGREQTTTSENRGVEFDQFPSELLSGVVVYKTPNAALVGQGLSGTVDMRTVRPLAFSDRVLTGNFRGDQNKVNGSSEYGNRYSASYIDQFLDHTFGVAIGYAHLDSPQPGYQNEAWGYATGTPAGSTTPVTVYGGGKLYKFDDNLKRDGLMATLQYKPNETWESTLDAFYSRFEKTEDKAGIEFGTAWGQGILQPGYVVNGNGTVTDSTWTNVKPVVRMDSNPFTDHLHSIGWNNRFKLSDHWDLNADLSLSDTKRQMRFLETYGGLTGNGTTTTRVQLDPSGDFNNITFDSDFGDPNNLQLIDAGNWGQDGYLKDFEIHDKLKAYRVDATRTFDAGAFNNLTFGFNRTDRTKDKSSVEAKLCLVACAGVGDSAPFPGTTSVFDFGGLDNLATYSAEDLLNSGIYNLQPKFHPDIANKNWSVHEIVDTYYVQLGIDSTVGSLPLRGNIGTQFVRVDQSSEGFSTFSGNASGTMESRGTKYDGLLPSLNLALEVMPEGYLRFGAAREMQRPRMDQMRASFDVSNSTSCSGIGGPIWCGTGGNPNLHPWLANAYDLSAEKYFTTEAGNKGYFAAAYFYKDLQTYIYEVYRPFDYTGLPLPPPESGQIPGVSYPTSTVGVMKQPVNGDGGLLAGFELTASMPLDLLWNPLNGFGIQASYSENRTSIHPNGPGTSEPLPGFSKYVSNVTAYWERNGFSVRLSERKRSSFRGETRGFGADLSYVDYQPEKVQDAQVNYTFANGALAGLSLYLQVSNIGDEPVRTADPADAGARPVQYFEYGRTTLLGFSYKF